ncbi:MAG: hypothetical protein GY940_39815 [bacterium]|nr:hypothetical protein [bacterium]
MQLTVSRLNSSDLGAGYNSSKPWRFNQYGLILGRTGFSNSAPDLFSRYENVQHWVWAHYNRDSFSGLWTGSFSFFNRANIPSCKSYVQQQCPGGGGGGSGGGNNQWNNRKACGFQIGASMFNKWNSLGGTRSVVGCPKMNETEAGRSPQGTTGRYALFQHGTMCTHRTGRYAGKSFEVHGDINRLYIGMRGTNSWLGFPISDEYSVQGGRRSNFEGGYIYWEARTRKTVAHRYSRQ